MKFATTFILAVLSLAILGCSSTPKKTIDDAPPALTNGADQAVNHAIDHGSMTGMSEEEHKKMMSQPGGSGDTDHSGHEGHHDHGAMPSNFGGPYQTMTAIGSGTSLIPADSPAYMWHFNLFEDRARCMVHAELKASFNSQGGPRGVSRFQSQNWLMGSCEVPVFGDSAFQFRAMLTAEPFTTPAGGVPQLFQTGETYGGREIVDAQHPHNLFSEMSVAFTQRLSDHFRYYLYFGLPGDREEGPTAFMHRASALENPGVPLCHHCQDAGHITNGVFSAGVEIDKLRIGASVFRGQEPGEDRYTISAGGFDSYSLRVQYAPTQNWVIGASYGRVHNAEPLHPGDMDRYTVFAQYSKRFDEGYVALSGVLGHNKESHGTLSGALVEGTVNFYDRNYIYGRGECVNKPGLTDSNIYGKAGLEHDEGGPGEEEHHVPLGNSTVCALTAGYARDVYASSLVRVGLGLDVTSYLVPKELEPIYGSSPLSFMFNIRIRPGRVF
ncbi:MAG: hypothetical protein IPO31_23645 [Candidatus Obscuribacter sp.]|nr:hypothetical protein [Candidatus Obscuribacter sp.]